MIQPHQDTHVHELQQKLLSISDDLAWGFPVLLRLWGCHGKGLQCKRHRRYVNKVISH